MSIRCALIWLASVFITLARAISYKREELIPLYYNKLFSHRTQIPYKYATQSFVCPPYTHNNWHQKPRVESWLVADQDWRGDWLVQSDFKIAALSNTDCSVLCTKEWTLEDSMVAKDLIGNEYQVEWWLDGLPGATASYTNEINTRSYRVGFPLGQVKDNQTFINNHVTFNILYTTSYHDRIDIIGFEVYPDSFANGQCSRTTVDYTMQDISETRKSITFTYSAKLPKTAQNRWDMYIIRPDTDSHFYALINSSITILFLLGVVLVIMMKTVQRDQPHLDDNDFKIHDDIEDAVGWRLIHRDVFRRPMYGGLLAPLIGSGVQVLVTGTACLAQPGSIIRLAAFFYVLSSVAAGYYSARIYKVFRGRSWFLNTALTATIVPGIIVSSLMLDGFLGWSIHSSRSMTVKGWMILVSLWLLVMAPLTFLGSFVGDRQERIEHPARTTQMPRFIPEKRWYQSYTMSIALGGVIPFAVVFVDLDELLTSMWSGEMHLSLYYASLACLLLGIATAAVSIALVFFQLCNEDYHWWWMSYAIGAASSLYTFAYALVFYWVRTNIEGITSGMIYIAHTLLGCLLLGLCTGTIGFFGTYSIIRKIYAAIKMD
ncbi:hypothetical protein BX666DRAFT_2022888 [Dichotomocladium elegans]|nr:hypothetical protein BX666DRAFT_2022888 [Dichotomocladium elegans]